MKEQVLQINLAEMSETELIKLLTDNELDTGSLLALLDSLFEMWSSALRFSAVVVEHGQNQFPEFLQTFIEHAGPRHGIPAMKLTQLLNMMKQRRPPSAIVH